MVPRLATCGATSAASPASRMVMLPAFSIRASGRPAWSNTMRPARKFSLEMLAVEAISPAASTCAPCEKTTPDWLTMATWPLAVIRPAMTEGSGVVTRFSVIACVEGWTTTQDWTGVRLSQLAEQAGADPAAVTDAFVRSLQPKGVLSKASLSGDQVRHPDALLALKVNGADLPLDHGYPARIIVPALPGVHNTKWVGSIAFGTAA